MLDTDLGKRGIVTRWIGDTDIRLTILNDVSQSARRSGHRQSNRGATNQQGAVVGAEVVDTVGEEKEHAIGWLHTLSPKSGGKALRSPQYFLVGEDRP
jgi:hypothetical protein